MSIFTGVHTDMLAYYAQCASSFDEVYEAPERQADLAQLHARLRKMFAGQRVLELACGTGYWTTSVAASATQVQATDFSDDMLAQARAKDFRTDNIIFEKTDAYVLQPDPSAEKFDACFAGCWWSHTLRERQAALLDNLRDQLAPNAPLILIDEVYKEGSSTPIARTDAAGNTYQILRLTNNERYEVLKNFPTDSTLRKRLGGHLKDIRIERFEHYWLLSGRFK